MKIDSRQSKKGRVGRSTRKRIKNSEATHYDTSVKSNKQNYFNDRKFQCQVFLKPC